MMKLLLEISHQLPADVAHLLARTRLQVMIVKSDSNWFHGADWAGEGGELVLPTYEVSGLMQGLSLAAKTFLTS